MPLACVLVCAQLASLQLFTLRDVSAVIEEARWAISGASKSEAALMTLDHRSLYFTQVRRAVPAP